MHDVAEDVLNASGQLQNQAGFVEVHPSYVAELSK